MKNFINNYLKEIEETASLLNKDVIQKIIFFLKKTKKNKGRIFFLGVGGRSGNATHAVNDFRKIANFECYSPSDNSSELTARINDDGWDSTYKNWLLTSNISKNDSIFIFSVGGGDIKRKISMNIVEAIKLAKKKKSTIISITGPNGGFAKKNSNACLIVPVLNKSNITAITESFQSIIWHLLVSHPDLKEKSMKWESILK